MLVLGIDPGLSGALAMYDGTNLLVVDMPTVEVVRNGKTKREVSAPSLADIISGAGIKYAYLERVRAMPGQGVTSMFSMGRSVGVVEGVLAGCMIPVTLVQPKAWQKSMEVRDGKDGSRERAMQLFPFNSDLFKRKMDHGRSDAALIAMYAFNQIRGK